MESIATALTRFLAETGAGNPRSTGSPAAVIDVFQEYLNGWAHEDLAPCERQRFEQESEEGRRFCDIFDARRIQPHHLNAMLGHFAVRHGFGTKGFLRAVGPVMEKLAAWLVHKGVWTVRDYASYRELAGERPGRRLAGCDEFARLLWQYVQAHPASAPDDLPAEDHRDEEFMIRSVEPGKLHLEALLDGDEIMLTLPKAVTATACAGWSVDLELARLRGRWRVLSVGDAYP